VKERREEGREEGRGEGREGGEREREREREMSNGTVARRASAQNCGTIYDSSPFVERHEGFPEIALNA